MGIVVNVLIYRNRCYVPISARIKTGGHVDQGPVHDAPLNIDALAEVIEKVRQLGNPEISAPSKDLLKLSREVMLDATDARSWKELAEHGLLYSLYWDHNKAMLYLSKRDSRGGFVFDTEISKQLPADTTSKHIAQVIIQDWNERM